jgi:hypothetical protein
VTGRALVFSNDKVVRRLKAAFVPFAGDKWYLNRQNDADGQFFRKLGRQTGRAGANGWGPQGVYVARPDGTLLAFDHFHPDPARFLAVLDKAETTAKTVVAAGNDAPAAAPTNAVDAVYARRLPPGGVVLNVFSRIPLDPPPGKTWTPNQATGRDHLWLTADDLRALTPPAWRAGLRYPVPPAVADRLIRYHLMDNVRGEPPFWTPGDVRERKLELVVEDAAARRVRLEGTARLTTGNNSSAPAATRGYDARVQGYLTWAGEPATGTESPRLSRFDFLAWGEAWGEGEVTKGAPPGRFPLVIAGRIAPPNDTAAQSVPPQGSKEGGAYLNSSAR